MCGPVAAQMSPGPLSKAHQDLGGEFACGKCHAFGKSSAEFKCLDCHQEIARRLAEKRGYHAAQVKAGTGSNDCARCHSEHNGRNYPLVRWPVPKARFDHAQAGWKLEGRHAALKCAACHTARYIDAQDRAVLKRHDLNATFAGLVSTCAACHQDVHAGQLGAACTQCHSQESWKNAVNFSHDRTRYPLTGMHARVACQQCHRPAPSAANGAVPYRNFVFYEQCASCHRDPHGGSFAGGCQRCHNTSGWKQLITSNGFNHDRTRFPLRGKHAALACKQCHKTDNFAAPLASARCLDCHQDMHAGQFAQRADGGDCKGCHNETGWKPALFTVADHARTAYPLLGRHAAVACGQCHTPRGKDTPYHMASNACTDCHRDAHAGQFAAAPHLNRCEDCHGVAGWRPAAFTIAAHNQTRFPLRGAHAAVACSDCHKPNGAATPYHPAAASCTDCHQNPHGVLAAAEACETCHSPVSWKERGRFDHSRTAFALLGRHASVDCLACHKPQASNGVRMVGFSGTPKECAGCHADVHDGQFRASGDEAGCARCHTTLNWQPTAFDHSRHSTFHLDGAHERVPCRMCHDRQRPAAGRTVVVYRGTPRECKQCHF